MNAISFELELAAIAGLDVAQNWLDDLMQELGTDDPLRAYRTFRTVLHALRERMMAYEWEASRLVSHFPLLLKGVFYGGGLLPPPHEEQRTRAAFLSQIRRECRWDDNIDPEIAARAVLHVIAQHMPADDGNEARYLLPEDIREFWP